MNDDTSRPHVDPVPRGLRVVAGWSWRILVVLALATALVLVIARLQVLFVALFVALLITALLQPGATRLRRMGLPDALATAAVLLVALGAVVGIVYLAVRSIVGQSDALGEAVTSGMDQVRTWLEATFGLSLEELESTAGGLFEGLGAGGGGLASSAFGVASTALEVVAGAGIALFATIFFVHDGAGIWSWLTSLFPGGARTHVDRAGLLAWDSLSSYARGTVLIAAIDAVGIGVGVALVGVPLAGTIAVIVFFGSFIPIVGALLSGLVAVLIALATKGLTAALLVAGIVVLVQQVEGHVLQPLIQGKLVALHPLAVVLAVAGGSTVAGLVGAVIAVPIVAVVNVLVRYAAGVSRGTAAADAANPPPAAPPPAGAARGAGPASASGAAPAAEPPPPPPGS